MLCTLLKLIDLKRQPPLYASDEDEFGYSYSEDEEEEYYDSSFEDTLDSDDDSAYGSVETEDGDSAASYSAFVPEDLDCVRAMFVDWLKNTQRSEWPRTKQDLL